MKSLSSFIVRVDKVSKDTIKMKDGTELYLDSKFNEFEHRTTHGEVISVPAKYDTGVKPGDTLYFHHHVVTQKRQELGLELNDDKYIVRYDPNELLANQAIAFKSKKTGKIKSIGGWLLMDPIPEDDSNEMVGSIEVVKLKKRLTSRAVFLDCNKPPKDYDLSPGDVVVFKKNTDYEIDIDGKTYIRMRPNELFYVEVQDS